MLFSDTLGKKEQLPKLRRQSFRCRLCSKRTTEQYVDGEPKSLYHARSQHLVAKHALHIDQFFAQFYRFETVRAVEQADVGDDLGMMNET